MIQFIVRYSCGSSENRAAFYEALRQENIPALVAGEEGCRCYDYYIPCEDPSGLLLLEEWENPEAQKKHIAQPHMAKVRALKAQFEVTSTLKSRSIQE